MSAIRGLLSLVLATGLASCSDFDLLGEGAACRNGLPSCRDGGPMDSGAMDAGAMDAGATDAGATDAGAMDAGGSDAGQVDAGTGDAGIINLTAAWNVREGGLFNAARPFRSGLAAMDGGLVLWFMSTINPEDVFDGPPKDLVGGYAVAIHTASHTWLLSDGGLGPRSGDAALAYLTSYVSPPNVTGGRATLAKAELLVDGGVLRYSDGGLLLSDGGQLQFSNQNATAFFGLDLPEVRGELLLYSLSQLPLAAGRLSTLDGGSDDATVLRSAGGGTQLGLVGAMTNVPAHNSCDALPSDVLTTHVNVSGGSTVDRLLTLSLCADGHVLSYSTQVQLSDVRLPAVTTARMAIADEGTPGRAPFVAASTSSSLTAYRFAPGGDAVSLSAPLVSAGTVPRVESMAVDAMNRPVLVLSVPANQPIVFDALGASVSSTSGLLLAGLDEELRVRWVGPLVVANGERLRSSAAVFSEGRLILGVECAAVTADGICKSSLSPALIRVGMFPSYDLP